MYDSFFKPTSDPKIIHFFITQSEKHTSAKFVRFKSLYKVYILGSQQQWFGKSHGATGFFFEHGFCSSISSLKKNASRDNQRQLYASVSIATCPFFSSTTDRGVFPSICLCPSVYYLSVNLFVDLLPIVWLESML